MNYQQILEEIASETAGEAGQGQLATYIPELAKVPPDRFGIHLATLDGGQFAFGDAEIPFSIQSIVKVLAVAMAYGKLGERLWQRVGVEPSGTAFNSLVQLEYEKGIPRNPLINAGAIVIADVLLDLLDDPETEFIAFVRKMAADETISYNLQVAEGEKATGFRNAAMANLLKSFGNIRNDVNRVLDFYFLSCSIEMSCRQLAQSFLPFANHGQLPGTTEKVLTISQTKRLNALMQTCGFYDEAGEFTFKVGLPGKSGVGGGIAAVCPKQFAVAVWSPLLNPKGNSHRGMKALELLTTKTGVSVF
jgi:glutaminase